MSDEQDCEDKKYQEIKLKGVQEEPLPPLKPQEPAGEIKKEVKTDRPDNVASTTTEVITPTISPKRAYVRRKPLSEKALAARRANIAKAQIRNGDAKTKSDIADKKEAEASKRLAEANEIKRQYESLMCNLTIKEMAAAREVPVVMPLNLKSEKITFENPPEKEEKKKNIVHEEPEDDFSSIKLVDEGKLMDSIEKVIKRMMPVAPIPPIVPTAPMNFYMGYPQTEKTSILSSNDEARKRLTTMRWDPILMKEVPL